MADSLYIHIPFCISKCKYCDFFSVTCVSTSALDSYVDALCNEINYRIKQFDVEEIETVYIGGGTPSLLNKNHLHSIFNAINSHVKIKENAEISIEVNPDDITDEILMEYEDCGINRISCGIQTLNDDALKIVSRRADVEKNRQALVKLSKNWGKEYSIDLICGLPEENKLTFLNTIRDVINYKPDHISMYSLTVEEETPIYKMIEDGQIDYDFDKIDEMWLLAKDFLEANGYKQYEVSNFCLDKKECRHNLKYWNHQNYIGIGSGGTGTVYSKNGEGFRWTNIKDINEYCNYWNEKKGEIPQDIERISISDSKFEFYMMGLRKITGITDLEYESIFGEKLPEAFITVCKKWQKKGLFKIINDETGVRYTLGKEGIIYLNQFLTQIME